MQLPQAPSSPTFWHVPEGSIFAIADEVLDLMPEIGYQVGEPERLAVRAMLPQRRDGRWAGLQSCIIAPRQNIKTASMIACAIHDTFIQDLDVVWTAHEFKTSADAFKDFQAIIEGNDELASEVLRVRTANGSEGYDLRSGASLRIIARSGRSGRGFSKVPRLYLDEGLYADAKMLGAITPTMGAIDNAHLVVGSSPGILSSEVLRDIRRRGRSGEDNDLGYVEWTSERRPCMRTDCTHAPGSDGCALDDEELWWQANPALGRRIQPDFLRNQRKVLAAAIPEFMREHMGWWEDPPTDSGVEPVIDLEEWAGRLDVESMLQPGDRVAVAVDLAWDRQTAWIAVAGIRSDGTPHVELVQSGHGTEWTIDFLRKFAPIWGPVGIGLQAGNAPVSSVLEPLQAEFDDLVKPLNGQDMGRACGTMFDAVVNGPLAHIGQQALDDMLAKAVARPIGDGWVWDRKASEIDIAGLVAVTEALYLALTAVDNGPSIYEERDPWIF